MRRFNIFDNNSTSVYSRVIRVLPQRYILLSALYLQKKDPKNLKFEEDYITIKRVLPIDSNECNCPSATCNVNPQLHITGHTNNVLNRTIYDEIGHKFDIMQGGTWTLTPCQNVCYLVVPAYYMLELSDECMLGSVFVLGEDYSSSELSAKQIPHDLVFGNLTI